MKTTEKYSHAYIIAGTAERAEEKAKDLAAALLCEGSGARPCGVCRHCRKVREGVHPDLITLSRREDGKGKTGKEIYVEQIRELAATAAVLPNEAERKVYLIYDAGSMNLAAQNAMLKLLEEPPSFDVFLLLTDSADRLLETVRSRCVTLRAAGGEETPPPQARDMAQRYLELSAAMARVSLLSFANEYGDLGNSEMLDFVRAARMMLADMLCGRLPELSMPRARLLRLAQLMDKAEEYLRFNVSTKHVLGMLSVESLR